MSRLFILYKQLLGFIWVSAKAYIFSTTNTSCAEKAHHLFLLEIQNPTPRGHHLSAPTKEPLRRYRQQDLQLYLALLITKPHSLCTNALGCASAHSYGMNAHHCCSYLRCGTCPPPAGRAYNRFKVTGILLVFREGDGPLPNSGGTTLIQYYCCPQLFLLQ